MTFFSSILAVGFVTPAFALAGLLLASIPILIHILNRRRYKQVSWAAMEFLLRAMRKNRKRLRFEQWLLLAVRCLVLGLLGLALARPMGCDQNTLAGFTGQKNGLHVLVIDNSYSMSYQADRPDAPTHLDQAKKLAKGVIARLSSGGESVAIITASRPASAVLIKPTFDLQSASSSIDRIQQSYSGTDLVGAMKLAVQIGQDDPRQTGKFLTLFTDATRSAWDNPQRDALNQAGRDVSKVFRVTHFNLGKPSQSNQAVLELKPASNLITARFGGDLSTLVRGFGNMSPSVLRIQQDGQPLPIGPALAFDPQSGPLIRPMIGFSSGGPHLFTANVVGNDHLSIDDTRYCVVDVASEMKVLIVEGERGTGALGSSGAFLSLALAPPKDGNSKSDSYILPEVISDLELGNKPLADYRAIVLAGVGQIQGPVADQLQRFVQQGGTLLLCMGEAVNSENYNQQLLPRKLLPGTLVRRINSAAEGRGFTFDFNSKGVIHPLLNVFRGEEKSGLDTAQVFTYWQTEIPPDSGVDRVLDYQAKEGSPTDNTGTMHKDPAITVHTLGEGRVVFYSTTVNADWTSFPAKPAYVTLMHELLTGTVRGGDQWMNLIVGQSLELPTSIKLTVVPTLSDNSQNAIPLDQITSNNRTVYRSAPLTRPGVYWLNTGLTRLPVAVNVPGDEADVRTLDDSAIKKALGEIDIDLQGDTLPVEASASFAGRDYGWNIMLMVLAFVVLESVLALRFGHYRRH